MPDITITNYREHVFSLFGTVQDIIALCKDNTGKQSKIHLQPVSDDKKTGFTPEEMHAVGMLMTLAYAHEMQHRTGDEFTLMQAIDALKHASAPGTSNIPMANIPMDIQHRLLPISRKESDGSTTIILSHPENQQFPYHMMQEAIKKTRTNILTAKLPDYKEHGYAEHELESAEAVRMIVTELAKLHGVADPECELKENGYNLHGNSYHLVTISEPALLTIRAHEKNQYMADPQIRL